MDDETECSLEEIQAAKEELIVEMIDNVERRLSRLEELVYKIHTQVQRRA